MVKLAAFTVPLRFVTPVLFRVRLWLPETVLFKLRLPVPVAIVVAPVKFTTSPRVRAVLSVVKVPARLSRPPPSVIRLPRVAPAARVVVPVVVRVRLCPVPVTVLLKVRSLLPAFNVRLLDKVTASPKVCTPLVVILPLS